MGGASGITLIPRLKALNPDIRILILTGYASISTAVEAIKLGATDYLAKPADTDQILAKLNGAEPDPDVEIADKPMSVGRLEWYRFAHQQINQPTQANSWFGLVTFDIE